MGNDHNHSCDPWDIPTVSLLEANFGGLKHPLEKKEKNRKLKGVAEEEEIVNFIDVIKNEKSSTLALAITNTNPNNYVIRHANEKFMNFCDQQKIFVGQSLTLLLGIELPPNIVQQTTATKNQLSEFDVAGKSDVRYHIRIAACRGFNGETKCLLWAIRKICNEKGRENEKDEKSNVNNNSSRIRSNSNSHSNTSNSNSRSIKGVLKRTEAHSTETKEYSSENKEKEKVPKKVQYNNKIRVILIPSRKEYFDRGLEVDLWHSREHLNSFAQHAVKEITEYMDGLSEKMPVKQVMMKLYQPDQESSLVDGKGGIKKERGVQSPTGMYCDYKVQFKRTFRTFLVRKEDLVPLKIGELLHIQSAKVDLHVGMFQSCESSHKPEVGGGVTYISPGNTHIHNTEDLLGKYTYIIKPVTETERRSYLSKIDEEKALLATARTATACIAAVTMIDMEYQFDRSRLTVFYDLKSDCSLCSGSLRSPSEGATSTEESVDGTDEQKQVRLSNTPEDTQGHCQCDEESLLMNKVQILNLIQPLLPVKLPITLYQLESCSFSTGY